MYAVITQLVGLIAMAVCVGSFQCKNSRTLILVQTLGNGLFIVQFLMLGAYSGCTNVAILCASNLVLCAEKPWADWRGWKWLFVALSLLSAVLTWDDIFSAFPCAASIVWLLSNWSRNGKFIRLCKIGVVGPGWILYNAHVHAWPGILCECFGVCSALWSIWRYGLNALDRRA